MRKTSYNLTPGGRARLLIAQNLQAYTGVAFIDEIVRRHAYEVRHYPHTAKRVPDLPNEAYISHTTVRLSETSAQLLRELALREHTFAGRVLETALSVDRYWWAVARGCNLFTCPYSVMYADYGE